VQTINAFITFTLIIRYQLMIPFAHNFNLLSINFQSRVIQNFNGPLEWTMSRIIFKHVSLQEKDPMIKKKCEDEIIKKRLNQTQIINQASTINPQKKSNATVH